MKEKPKPMSPLEAAGQAVRVYSTRYTGQNGLRNADEVAQAAVLAFLRAITVEALELRTDGIRLVGAYQMTSPWENEEAILQAIIGLAEGQP
jgi:hypothetical protein